MMRVCHLNTCPVGIATQDPRLRKKFAGKPEHVVNFMTFVAEELREIMAELGFRTLDEMVGRVDRLDVRDVIRATGRRRASISPPILHQPDVAPDVADPLRRDARTTASTRRSTGQLIERCQPALERREPVALDLPIRNVNRTACTMLSAEVSRRHGAGRPAARHDQASSSPAPPGRASAPSWRPASRSRLEGDANDYFGKGLSGGRIVVYPPAQAHVRRRGQHHRRQRVALRRHGRRGVPPRPGRRALLRPQQRRHGGRRGRGRPRLRVHDAGHRRGPRRHRPQLRRRHERRRRLRARRGRHLRARAATWAWSSSIRSTRRMPRPSAT